MGLRILGMDLSSHSLGPASCVCLVWIMSSLLTTFFSFFLPPQFYNFQEQKTYMVSFTKLVWQKTKAQYKDNPIAGDQKSESRCEGAILHHMYNVVWTK